MCVDLQVKYLHYIVTYHVVQGNEKDRIYQSAQIEEPEPAEVSSIGVLHHQLFQEHWQHMHEPSRR